MFSFSEFLAERATVKKGGKSKPKATEREAGGRGQGNDDKGKLAEIHLAHHLGSHLVGEGERYYPSHFRGEEGTPQEIEAGVLKRQGREHHEAVDRHSEQTSNAIIEHLIKTGRIRNRNDIEGVHWTSNPDKVSKSGEKTNGDHAKLTDVHDPNQKGDLILSTRNAEGKRDFIPISSKYGSQDEPNYAGWGLDRMGKESGMQVDPNTGLNPLEQIKTEQEEELEKKLGRFHGAAAGATSAKQKHDLFRPDRNAHEDEMKVVSAGRKDYAKQLKAWERAAAKAKASGGKVPAKPKPPSERLSPGAQRAQQAYDIALKHRRRMAETLAGAINKKVEAAGHDGPIRDWITKAISEPTAFKTVIAHSHTDKNNPHGDANSLVYDQDDVAPHILNQYEGLQARVGRGDEGEDSDGSISVHFYGRHKKTGQWERVATQGIKGNNGPYKGTNGFFNIQNSDHQEQDNSNEAVPQNHQVADSQSGEPVEVKPHIPDSATIDSPAARRRQRFRASLQQTAADTGGASESPFISRPKPGIAGFRKFTAPEQQEPAQQGGFAAMPAPKASRTPRAERPIDPHEHKQYVSGEHGGMSFRGPGDM